MNPGTFTLFKFLTHVDEGDDIKSSTLETEERMLFESKTTGCSNVPTPMDLLEKVLPKGHPGAFRCKQTRPLEDL